MFYGLTAAELSRLIDLLFDAESRFGKAFGPRSDLAIEMSILLWEIPVFEYEDPS